VFKPAHASVIEEVNFQVDSVFEIQFRQNFRQWLNISYANQDSATRKVSIHNSYSLYHSSSHVDWFPFRKTRIQVVQGWLSQAQRLCNLKISDASHGFLTFISTTISGFWPGIVRRHSISLSLINANQYLSKTI
jgi:hypothetical protein